VLVNTRQHCPRLSRLFNATPRTHKVHLSVDNTPPGLAKKIRIAPCQDRTGDLQIMRLTLYQLSQRSGILVLLRRIKPNHSRYLSSVDIAYGRCITNMNLLACSCQRIDVLIGVDRLFSAPQTEQMSPLPPQTQRPHTPRACHKHTVWVVQHDLCTRTRFDIAQTQTRTHIPVRKQTHTTHNTHAKRAHAIRRIRSICNSAASEM
jgi:hypothetical protein